MFQTVRDNAAKRVKNAPAGRAPAPLTAKEIMRRIATVATTSLALTVFATLAGLAITSTPALAASGISCSSLKGTATGTVTIGRCAPQQKANTSASGAATSLISGGTVTWKSSGQTTIITLSVHSPGQGSCKKGSKEEDATGSVTGGTSTYTKAGNPVAIRACFTQQGGTLSLVKGSKAQL